MLYLPPAASAARYAPLILELGPAAQVMVVSGYPEGPHQGALLWVALDYRRLGEKRRPWPGGSCRGGPQKNSHGRLTPVKVEVDEKLLRTLERLPRETLG